MKRISGKGYHYIGYKIAKKLSVNLPKNDEVLLKTGAKLKKDQSGRWVIKSYAFDDSDFYNLFKN